MKIWKLWSQCEIYDDLDMVEPMELEERQTFDGRSKIKDWVPPEMKRLQPKENRPLGDYMGFQFNIFNKKTLDILMPLIKGNIEALPVIFDEGEYYLINVTTVVNCVNYEKSQFDYFSDGKRIMMFDKYSFIESKVSGINIFKIIDEPWSYIFLSDKFKETVEKAGLTGFEFELVWDSEAKD